MQILNGLGAAIGYDMFLTNRTPLQYSTRGQLLTAATTVFRLQSGSCDGFQDLRSWKYVPRNHTAMSASTLLLVG
jgi:hypothetical protein